MMGIADVDHDRSMQLVELAVDFAGRALRPGGDLLVKVFQGREFQPLMPRLRKDFETVKLRKPKASRPAVPRSTFWHAGIDWCSVKRRRYPGSTARSAPAHPRSKALNDLAKNVVLWIVIAVVLATVVSNFSSRARPCRKCRTRRS